MEIGRVDYASGVTQLTSQSPLTPQQRIQQAELIHAVEAMNQTELFGQSNELTYSFDRESRKLILQLVNRETKEVVRQIPPEYLLRLAEDAKRQK